MAKVPDDLVDVSPGGYISLEQKKTEQAPAAQVAPSDAFTVDPDYVAKQVDLLNPATQVAAAGAAARPLVKKMIGMDEQTGRQSLETYLKSQIHHKYPGLNLAALEKEVQKIYGPQARVSTMAEVQAALDALKGPVFGQPTVDLSPYTKNIMAQPTTRGKAEAVAKTIGENINPITGQGFGAKTMRTAGRGALGAATGIQGASAYNRLQEGDITGSAISGVGALGSGLLTSRNPKAKGIGAVLQGLSLPAQFLRPEESVMEEKAKGGLVHLAKGKAVKKLSEVLVPHEGKTLLGTMADRTKATEGFSGGPGFINLHPEYTWAVDALNPASRHMNAIKAAGGPERTVVAPMLMSPQAHKSNRPVFEKMYAQLLEDVKSGKVTPEQIEKLNNRIAIEKTLSNAPDITSKEFLDYANAFHRRGSIADIMGKKKIGAVDLQKHLDETIDPALREAKLGSIGPQLFTMESHMLKPDVHPGYKYVFTGEKGQDQFVPVPREFLFRDLEAKSMRELGRPLTDYNYRTSVGIPSQLIDEKLLRELQEKGYAKGGKIAKATRDLILPPAENAARTQRINTIPTYQKAGELFNQRGATGQALDFSAGLGEGAKFLGPNTLTYEPFAQGWKPTFSKASEIPSEAFGKVANLNSLNVVPRETRDEMVLDIGRAMERGGHGIITTRGPEVLTAKGIPGPEPTSIITSSDTYQKGFTRQELEDYLRYMLGDKFDVNKVKLGPAGAYIEKKAEGGRAVNLQEKKEKSPFSFSMNELKPMPGSETLGMQLPPGVVARLQLEKELEKAKLRAGMSGLAMAVPGKQGVQTIPGAYDVGVNMPVGKGNLDVGAFRSMQPIPDKGYAQGVNVKYTMPFAEGGSTTPAWQRKEGKSPSGGLNALGRASYKRETGGTLKAPQPEGGSRKKSFCARMGGMKKKLTSSKTANDPDSRINKALRKWKC